MTKPLPACPIDPKDARGRATGSRTRSASGLLRDPLVIAALFWAALFAASPSPAAAGTAGIDAAVEEVRGAVRALHGRVDRLPRQAQLGIGTEVRVLAHAVADRLDRLDREPAAAASPGLGQDLLFLHDLMRAVGAELDRVSARGDRNRDAEVRRLADAAEERLATVMSEFERTADLFESAVVTVEQTDDGVLVHTIDRTVYDGVRLVAIGLFLVGLLAIGLRLLMLSETEMSVFDLVGQAPVLAVGGILSVGAFLLASASLAVDPALIADLAGRGEFRPAPAACERLAVQREHLLDARALEHDGLGDAVKDRMRPVAQDCLNLESQVAAVEAVEWLAANLDPLEAGAPGRRVAVVETGSERLPTTPQPRREAPTASETPDPIEPGDLATGGPIEELEDDGAPGDEPSSARRVVTTTRVNYRSGPGTDARRLGTLPEGAPAILLGEDGSWSNIQLEDGRSVYVASTYLRG